MSDDPVRTRVLAHGRWWPFQEFMIKAHAEGPIDDVTFAGASSAAATPEALEAIAAARAVVIGPSNPVISIGPIVATGGVRDALIETPAPVVAVSPIVHGDVLKPATTPLMRWAGYELSATGIAGFYDGLLDGLVADEHTDAVAVLQTDVLMADADGRRRLAEQTLTFALGLSKV
jgi:LPPG:FO 2-phospho-L-lactate transferase